jgi:REP element-mobilizing transposase RayT
MARKARLASETGVYHVMLRGVNRQDIFECDKDYLKFLDLLRRAAFPRDENNKPMPPNLVIYAYCLMPNHVHLLVKEVPRMLISDAMKSISIAYAWYFNHKYEHCGHLFQDRFRSEVVRDIEYFITLMRYIHQNPVAAMICSDVNHYRWSSWCEYNTTMPCDVHVCSASSVLQKIPYKELEGYVYEPMPKAQKILDFNNDTSIRLSDDIIRDFAEFECGVKITDIQKLEKKERNAVLLKILQFGAGIRQLARMTGICKTVVERVKTKGDKGDG